MYFSVLQGQPPGRTDQRYTQNRQAAIESAAGSAKFAQQAFGGQTQNKTTAETEQMSANIGAFSRTAKQRQQGESGGDRQCPAWPQALAFAQHPDGGENADGTENCRRSTNSAMVGRLEQGIAQISQSTTGQHQRPAEARTQILAEALDEQPA